MRSRIPALVAPLFALVAAGFLLVAGPSTALYIVTPLVLESDAGHAEVGDTVHDTVRAQNETEAAAWAGKTVRVVAVWTENQTETPDGGVSDGDERSLDVATLTLGEDAGATFEWVVPQEVDDENVNLRILSDEAEEPLAFADLAVGDAEPIMRIAASGPNDGPVEPAPEETGGDEPAQDHETPGAPVALVALAAAGVALLLRRKTG